MAVCEKTESLEKRLSQQLHRFSELSEILTLRLLELEERLLALELTQTPKEIGNESIAHRLLSESEQTVLHLHDLLDTPKNGESGMHVVADNLADEDSYSNSEWEQSSDRTENVCLEENLEESEIALAEINASDDDALEEQETQYVDDPQMPLLSA